MSCLGADTAPGPPLSLSADSAQCQAAGALVFARNPHGERLALLGLHPERGWEAFLVPREREAIYGGELEAVECTAARAVFEQTKGVLADVDCILRLITEQGSVRHVGQPPTCNIRFLVEVYYNSRLPEIFQQFHPRPDDVPDRGFPAMQSLAWLPVADLGVSFWQGRPINFSEGFRRFALSMLAPSSPEGPVPAAARRFDIFVSRHGERMDQVFGPNWVQECFDAGGGYTARDLNMPQKLVGRPPHHWAVDTPLTELGRWQAHRVAASLASSPEGAAVCAVVCSPAFRCVQTAAEMALVLPGRPLIAVEPGLLEMGVWMARGLSPEPVFMSPQALMDYGFPVNPSIECLGSLPPADEDPESFYRRSAAVMSALLTRHAMAGCTGGLLIVAHALSHDTLSYGLRQGDPLSVPIEVGQAHTPHLRTSKMIERASCKRRGPVESYCGVAHFRYETSFKVLEIADSSGLSLTHHSNKRFIFGGEAS